MFALLITASADVMFGWVFGLAWLALLITVHRIVLKLELRDRRIAELGGIPDQAPEEAIERGR
ncbi:MAG: hypothetical protein WAS07_08100 [Micropruina sp.]|nr:hypothetical protein [Micropruina sp.]